jgi:two-component system response regulator FlrC
MYESQPIELFWDNSADLDAHTVAALNSSGFRARPVALNQLSNQLVAGEAGPRVVCVQGRPGTSEAHIRALRELLGPRVYLILRVGINDLNTAIVGVKSGVDDVITADADCKIWQDVAASARLRLLKYESYVFVDETSQQLLALVERVGASEVTVLLQGATGSGKEVLARLAHDFSPRRDGPFIPVNCAALPENLAESLLFGHMRGAFTGATRNTDGFFTQAHGGTLFLDEVGELSPQLQAKLLRAIQEKEVLPVGSSESHKVDVRIVSATNRDLRAGYTDNPFREDLYFRISTFRINVPSLSARLDDVLPLANFFILKHSRENRALQFSPEAVAKLLAYTWPGNVRELENVVQRAIVLTTGDVIHSQYLIFDEPMGQVATQPTVAAAPVAVQPSKAESAAKVDGLQDAMDANEFRIIAETIRTSPTRQAAAAALGISERTLRYKLARMRERGMELPRRKSA